MEVLSQVFGIHPLTTEDILYEETREKIDPYPALNYYFVSFRSFNQDRLSPSYLDPVNIYIVVFPHGALSFHSRGTPHPHNVRKRIKRLRGSIGVTSDWISYALLDDMVDAFSPLIEELTVETEEIDDRVLVLLGDEEEDMLARIGSCRKKVMGLLRLMGNKTGVVRGLIKRSSESGQMGGKLDISLYLSDVLDHTAMSAQNLAYSEKVLSRSHGNYLAQISIEMAGTNNRVQNFLIKLTVFGTILFPMNIITGLWGMNVRVPGRPSKQDGTDIPGLDNVKWFFGIVGGLCAIALTGVWVTQKVFADRRNR
ncbi:hypothetical protein RQP46_001341 [Phenoliferia psychrophenolica]